MGWPRTKILRYGSNKMIRTKTKDQGKRRKRKKEEMGDEPSPKAADHFIDSTNLCIRTMASCTSFFSVAKLRRM